MRILSDRHLCEDFVFKQKDPSVPKNNEAVERRIAHKLRNNEQNVENVENVGLLFGTNLTAWMFPMP